ncbi:hypothetical protein BOWSER_59 [Gordonia phage Bowser]|uniref:Uncharacterized protein n=1 Tax=Gordonia phage Bowser TaxID=1838063 RepID=A0A160DF77_9CAUD|nr:hypothetical protein BH770_gp59 [Gordonia phage Bowser]ANA85454.1 hypothetical protein BOWSER_59 [Gordonia phage Bowser]
MMDFPTAWAFVKTTHCIDHDPRCSFRQTCGAVLCDCHVLNDEVARVEAAAMGDGQDSGDR